MANIRLVVDNTGVTALSAEELKDLIAEVKERTGPDFSKPKRKLLWHYHRVSEAAIAYKVAYAVLGEFIKQFQDLHKLKDTGASNVTLRIYCAQIFKMMRDKENAK